MRGRGGKGVTVFAVLVQLLPGALLAALFVAVGIIHVTSRVAVVDAGYRLSKLEQEGRKLQHENDQLKLELATLKAPARLERLARTKLKMSAPLPSQVLSLSPEAKKAEAPKVAARRKAQDARAETVR